MLLQIFLENTFIIFYFFMHKPDYTQTPASSAVPLKSQMGNSCKGEMLKVF